MKCNYRSNYHDGRDYVINQGKIINEWKLQWKWDMRVYSAI